MALLVPSTISKLPLLGVDFRIGLISAFYFGLILVAIFSCNSRRYSIPVYSLFYFNYLILSYYFLNSNNIFPPSSYSDLFFDASTNQKKFFQPFLQEKILIN